MRRPWIPQMVEIWGYANRTADPRADFGAGRAPVVGEEFHELVDFRGNPIDDRSGGLPAPMEEGQSNVP